jgi:signal transduction histidine kinase
VAHDVNNAIGAILPLAQQIRAELVERTADPADLVEDLDIIIEKTRLCQRIFGNMVRTGVRRSGTGPINLNQVIREMLPILEAQVSQRPIDIVADLDARLPVVACSKHELEHVVLNLVTNSIDALGAGPGRIELETTALDQGPESGPVGVRLEVRDDGPGMDAELLAKVHEPFFSTKRGGTGLGLPICRSLLWQLGGIMSVASEPGRGTRVVVELPAAQTLPEPQPEQ